MNIECDSCGRVCTLCPKCDDKTQCDHCHWCSSCEAEGLDQPECNISGYDPEKLATVVNVTLQQREDGTWLARENYYGLMDTANDEKMAVSRLLSLLYTYLAMREHPPRTVEVRVAKLSPENIAQKFNGEFG